MKSTETTRPRTIEEAADELNLSIHTIRAWVTQRRIGCVRLGRAVRIPATEIHRLLEAGAAPALQQEEKTT